MNVSMRTAFCAAMLTVFVAVPAAAAKRVVDSSDGQGSATNCNATAAAYFSISAALAASAATGDTIVICPGAGPYNEQLTIDKNIKLQGVRNATVRPSPMVQNTTSLSTGA